MRRLTLDDDYMMRLHTAHTPMQIGSLQYYEVPPPRRGSFAVDVRAHLSRRLPSSGLYCVRRKAPWGIDTDIWTDLTDVDLDRHITVIRASAPPPRREVTDMVARWVTEHLDPDEPPFRIVVVDALADGSAAVFLAINHALADGIGFQSIVGRLTDPTEIPAPSPSSRHHDERVPTTPEWISRSALRFAKEAARRRRGAQDLSRAGEAMSAFKAVPGHRRAKTPRFALSGPTSEKRSYCTVSLSLHQMKHLADRLGGTVNDVFLAVGSGAVRSYLLERGLLPDEPLVALAARSYRRPEHGELGNRIISIQAALATSEVDPLSRFAAIRSSMAVEMERSRLHEQLIDHDDRPFGSRRRARRYAERQAGGDAVLPGNLTLSNVPGPSEARYLAGYLQTANYPAPILGSGRFLNMTLRRYRSALDLGIMADATKVPDAAVLVPRLSRAIEELEEAVRSRPATMP